MLLKPVLRELKDRKIPIPWADGSPGLDSHSTNYLYRLALPDNISVAEFVLTPFPRQVWADLWYVKLVNRERKGVVALFSSLMRDRGINIIRTDSSTILQGAYHSSRIALDCSAYNSDVDGTHGERRSNPEAHLMQLQDELTLQLIDHLRFFDPAFPCISIERDLTLWMLDKTFTESGAARLHEKPVKVEQGCFEISAEEIERVKKRCHILDVNVMPQMLESYDAESGLLRVVLFFKDRGIIPLALTFDNAPGAIAALTSTLSNNDCNILASRFLSIDEDRMFAWILLEHLAADPKRKEDVFVSNWVSGIVMTSDMLSDFSPRLAAY